MFKGIKLYEVLLLLSVAMFVTVGTSEATDAKGYNAEPFPMVAILIVGLVLAIAAATAYVLRPKQPAEVDEAAVQMDRIAAPQEPSSSGSRLAWTRLDDSTSKDESPRTVITPAFGFNLAPGLDRSHRQPAPMPTLYGLIDREEHPEFFGPLAGGQHFKAVS